MSEPEPVQGAGADTSSIDATPSTSELAGSVRRLKRWLVALTVVVALVVVGAIAAAGIIAWGIFGISRMDADPTAPTARTIDSVRAEIKSALGDKLESVDVRLVSVGYGEGPPFPYSLIYGVGDDKSVYVQYRLKGSSVLVAGILDGPFGTDISSSGMLPTRGSLISRMTDAQFTKILAAYAAQTRAPLGSVRRYSDRSSMSDAPVPDKVPVGAQEFPSKELWSVTQGTVVKGDRVTIDEVSDLEGKSLVFHEDPESGEFTYIGSESDYGMDGP
jgi:hypothetical protein